jgi:hypothetical protein
MMDGLLAYVADESTREIMVDRRWTFQNGSSSTARQQHLLNRPMGMTVVGGPPPGSRHGIFFFGRRSPKKASREGQMFRKTEVAESPIPSHTDVVAVVVSTRTSTRLCYGIMLRSWRQDNMARLRYYVTNDSGRPRPVHELHPLLRGNRYMSQRRRVIPVGAHAPTLAEFGFALILARDSSVAHRQRWNFPSSHRTEVHMEGNCALSRANMASILSPTPYH